MRLPHSALVILALTLWCTGSAHASMDNYCPDSGRAAATEVLQRNIAGAVQHGNDFGVPGTDLTIELPDDAFYCIMTYDASITLSVSYSNGDSTFVRVFKTADPSADLKKVRDQIAIYPGDDNGKAWIIAPATVVAIERLP